MSPRPKFSLSALVLRGRLSGFASLVILSLLTMFWAVPGFAETVILDGDDLIIDGQDYRLEGVDAFEGNQMMRPEIQNSIEASELEQYGPPIFEILLRIDVANQNPP